MAEQESIEAELQSLRRAADQGDWNGCCDALENLLRRLAPARAMELARQQVERRLPLFEQQNPTVTWPRDFIENLRVADASAEGGRKWPWENDEFPGPGANNFTHGIDELWRARRLPASDPRRVEMMVSAIATVILAEATSTWGARHPDQWAYWYASIMSGEADPRQGRIMLACSQDPESVRIKREAWHEVADRLSEALGLTRAAPENG